MFFLVSGWVSLAELYDELITSVVGQWNVQSRASSLGDTLIPQSRERTIDIPFDEMVLLKDTTKPSALTSTVKDHVTGNPIYQEQREVNLATWSICDEMDEVGVMTAEGKIIRADRRFLSWYDPTSQHGIFTTLSVGTIGTGTGFFVGPEFESEKESYFEIVRGRYGGFLYQPIFLQRKMVQPLVKEYDPSLLKVAGSKSIVDEIVQAVDDGEPVSKAWVKQRFGTGMKTAEFQSIWIDAAKLRPELSRPGPRNSG